MTHWIFQLVDLYALFGVALGGYSLGSIHEAEGRLDSIAWLVAACACVGWPLVLVWHLLTKKT